MDKDIVEEGVKPFYLNKKNKLKKRLTNKYKYDIVFI